MAKTSKRIGKMASKLLKKDLPRRKICCRKCFETEKREVISISEEIFFWLILGITASRSEIVKRA